MDQREDEGGDAEEHRHRQNEAPRQISQHEVIVPAARSPRKDEPLPLQSVAMSTCAACGENLPVGATKCPLCLVPVQVEEEEVYNLDSSSDTIPAEWEGGAVYTLEFAARCPHCRELIRSLRVLRLKRSQVSFTSPLPRAGRALVCISCRGIISADVSTL